MSRFVVFALMVAACSAPQEAAPTSAAQDRALRFLAGPGAEPLPFVRCTLVENAPGPTWGPPIGVATDGASMDLYVAIEPLVNDDPAAWSAARWVLTSAMPCVLEHDASFAAAGRFDAVDDAGGLWAFDGDVRRGYPAPPITCPVDARVVLPAELLVDARGEGGWLLAAQGGAWRYSVDAGPCTARDGVKMSAFAPSGVGAIDAGERLHVLGTSADGSLEALVLDADGALRARYPVVEAGDGRSAAATRCPGGVCIVTAGVVGIYDADGVHRRSFLLPAGTTRLVATGSGPIFAMGPEGVFLARL